MPDTSYKFTFRPSARLLAWLPILAAAALSESIKATRERCYRYKPFTYHYRIDWADRMFGPNAPHLPMLVHIEEFAGIPLHAQGSFLWQSASPGEGKTGAGADA